MHTNIKVEASKANVDDSNTERGVRLLVETHGVAGAARLLGVSPAAIARLLAHLTVHEGTKALFRERLATLAETSVA